MDTPNDLLQRVFRLSQFRPHQRQVIDDVVQGRDVVCVMPTGAGKSLCFQLPALMQKGLTVVVSPLISLMADQVRHLQALGIPVLLLNSSVSSRDQARVLEQLRNGFQGMLYLAPERFAAPSFHRLLPQLRPNLLVVDEAHCLSFWGHDFRPDYMRLAEVREQLGSPVTMALTATATPNVRDDIVKMLRLRQPAVHVTGFDRPNLVYACRRLDTEAEKDTSLLHGLSKQAGSGIVYCSTRRLVEQLTALFQQRFPQRTVRAYHAGMDASDRKQSQEDFMNSAGAVVVATNAFGMGINKADIRFVVHYNIPASLEAYYQEAGRAGRDGRTAQCILYCSPRDKHTQEFFIDKIGDNNSELSPAQIATLQEHARRKLDQVFHYAYRAQCRRRAILDYFGDRTDVTNCTCDVCRGDLRSTPARTGNVSPRAKTSKRLASRSGAIDGQLDPAAELRFERLKKTRLDLAKEQQWPAFFIAHDSLLREVARVAPTSLNALAEIKGIGAEKLQKFGSAFLEALKES
jgi:ATP-dependent DNA helicase RecQ